MAFRTDQDGSSIACVNSDKEPEVRVLAFCFPDQQRGVCTQIFEQGNRCGAADSEKRLRTFKDQARRLANCLVESKQSDVRVSAIMSLIEGEVSLHSFLHDWLESEAAESGNNFADLKSDQDGPFIAIDTASGEILQRLSSLAFGQVLDPSIQFHPISFGASEANKQTHSGPEKAIRDFELRL